MTTKSLETATISRFANRPSKGSIFSGVSSLARSFSPKISCGPTTELSRSTKIPFIKLNPKTFQSENIMVSRTPLPQKSSQEVGVLLNV